MDDVEDDIEDRKYAEDQQSRYREVAVAIKDQIGLSPMLRLGAHNLSVSTDGPALEFDVCGSKECGSIRIELSDDDTYGEAYEVSGYKNKKSNDLIAKYNGIFAGQLHKILSDITKLRIV